MSPAKLPLFLLERALEPELLHSQHEYKLHPSIHPFCWLAPAPVIVFFSEGPATIYPYRSGRLDLTPVGTCDKRAAENENVRERITKAARAARTAGRMTTVAGGPHVCRVYPRTNPSVSTTMTELRDIGSHAFHSGRLPRRRAVLPKTTHYRPATAALAAGATTYRWRRWGWEGGSVSSVNRTARPLGGHPGHVASVARPAYRSRTETAVPTACRTGDARTSGFWCHCTAQHCPQKRKSGGS
jgi:hypothetical protein